MPSKRLNASLAWGAQLIAAAILGTASYSKLSGMADSVALFTLLGVEPWGRIAVGALEAVATLLILWPGSAILGAALGALLMFGAIGTHIFKIGVRYGDNPDLFIMAWIVLLMCLATAWFRGRVEKVSEG
jgi:uncharacterized membrane protein YphA (DoxX/SURF4 family)